MDTERYVLDKKPSAVLFGTFRAFKVTVLGCIHIQGENGTRVDLQLSSFTVVVTCCKVSSQLW